VNPHIYLHEIIRTVPGREEAYAASVLSLHHDPTRQGSAEHRGALQFRSAQTSGAWPCVINIWQNTWAGQASNLVSQFQDRKRDTAMEEWWNRNLHLRRGGYDRILIPAACSPTCEELAQRGARAEVVVHEILWLPFGEPEKYLAELERLLLPAARRCGVELIGAFRVAMRPRQVLTLLGAREWSGLAALLEAAQSDAALREWNAYRSARTARAEELVLLPVRHDPLAGRRGEARH
jgi:hypothetical protein